MHGKKLTVSGVQFLYMKTNDRGTDSKINWSEGCENYIEYLLIFRDILR